MFRLFPFIAFAVSVASQCTLCPDGNDPILPSNNQTAEVCRKVIELLPSLDADGCPGIQQGEYPRLCGCFENSNFTCDICPDGGTPNPFGQTNIDACKTAQFAAELSTTAEECTANLASSASRFNITEVCGCPGVPTVCTICPDGSSVGNPSAPLGIANTCASYETFLNTFTQESDKCLRNSDSGLSFVCQCPGIGDGKPCSICSNGDVRGDPRVPGFEDYCRNADYKAYFIPLDLCEALTDSYDQWACGCPAAVSECPLCEDGSTFTLDRPSNFSKINETCAFDQFSLQYLVNLDCAAAQATVGQDCGCDNPNADLTVCKLCGAGRELPDPNLYVPSFGHTCSFIEYFATSEANAGKKSCTFYRGEYVDVCCNGKPDPYKTSAPGLPTASPVEIPAPIVLTNAPMIVSPFAVPTASTPILVTPVAPSVVAPTENSPISAPIVVTPVSPSVTEPPVAPSVTEPPVAPSVTEPPVAPSVTEPPVAPSVTKPPVVPSLNSPISAPIVVTNPVAPSAINPVAPSVTNPAVAPSVTNPVAPSAINPVAPSVTKPAVAPSVTNPVAPSVTKPAVAPSVTNPVAPSAINPVAPSVTNPAVAPSVTNPVAPSAINPPFALPVFTPHTPGPVTTVPATFAPIATNPGSTAPVAFTDTPGPITSLPVIVTPETSAPVMVSPGTSAPVDGTTPSPVVASPSTAAPADVTTPSPVMASPGTSAPADGTTPAPVMVSPGSTAPVKDTAPAPVMVSPVLVTSAPVSSNVTSTPMTSSPNSPPTSGATKASLLILLFVGVLVSMA